MDGLQLQIDAALESVDLEATFGLIFSLICGLLLSILITRCRLMGTLFQSLPFIKKREYAHRLILIIIFI
jgi:hypothetical protein